MYCFYSRSQCESRADVHPFRVLFFQCSTLTNEELSSILSLATSLESKHLQRFLQIIQTWYIYQLPNYISWISVQVSWEGCHCPSILMKPRPLMESTHSLLASIPRRHTGSRNTVGNKVRWAVQSSSGSDTTAIVRALVASIVPDPLITPPLFQSSTPTDDDLSSNRSVNDISALTIYSANPT